MSRILFFLMLVLASKYSLAAYVGPLDRGSAPDLDQALKSRVLSIDKAGERLVAVGRRGHILVSDDVGESWRQQQSPVASDLVDVFFVNARTGWIVGHDGVVLKTSDAGDNWEVMLNGIKAAAIIERFLADGHDLSEEAVVELERFASEADDKPFLSVHFISEDVGFVFGAFNFAFQTQDGGTTWQPYSYRVENGSGFHLYSLFRHGDDLYAVGEKGLLLRWNRSEDRFVALVSPYNGTWFGGSSLGDDLLLFGLRGNVYLGSDEAGWNRVSLGITDSINNGFRLSEQATILVSQSGRAFLLERQTDKNRVKEITMPTGMPLYDVTKAGNKIVFVGARGISQVRLAD